MKIAAPKRFRYFNNKCYILNKFHLSKVQSLQDSFRDERKRFHSMEYAFDKQTETLNQLQKDFNKISSDYRLKDIECNELHTMISDANHESFMLSEQNNIDAKSFKSRIFWLWIWATLTTATTLLFVGYHIYKTL